MKKFVFAVVIAAIAASPAAASTNSNENSWKFAKDAFPIFLPSWSIPIYLSAKNAQ
jgi:opacity protein-like surface antigen